MTLSERARRDRIAEQILCSPLGAKLRELAAANAGGVPTLVPQILAALVYDQAEAFLAEGKRRAEKTANGDAPGEAPS